MTDATSRTHECPNCGGPMVLIGWDAGGELEGCPQCTQIQPLEGKGPADDWLSSDINIGIPQRE